MDRAQQQPMVRVMWDTKEAVIPSTYVRGDSVLAWNPWGEMCDRHLYVNDQPVDYDAPLVLHDGDRLLSVPRGSY